MTVPMLNPIGLHSQLLDASVQAADRGAAVVVVERVPVIGLTRRVAHAANDATKNREYRQYANGVHQPVACTLFVYRPPCIMKSVSAGRTIDVQNGAGERKLVPPAGFEPTAPGLGILCSIHLS